MNRQEKEASVALITEHLKEANSVYLADYSGLTVAQTNELRNRFREAGVKYTVYKNTLAKRAMQDVGGYDDLLEHLSGPTAFAFTTDPAAPAKVIKKFLKDEKIEKPEFRAAVIDGGFYGAAQLDQLAALKSRDELLSDVIGLLLSPMSNVVGSLQSVGSGLVSSIKEIANKAEG